MLDELTPLLDRVETEACAIAQRYRAELRDEDHHMLVLAFYRAETLAEYALLEAHAQVPTAYQEELAEQIEDERRHVAVFADWMQEPPEIPVPKSKRRPNDVWYSVLLANEIAGYCQFHMLAGLLADPARREAVESIARDERRHIARLTRWIRQYAGQPTWGSITQVTSAFRRRLDTRMEQFLPRSELSDVRKDMAQLIDSCLLDALALAEGQR